MLSDIENMDLLTGNSDVNSIERELRDVYERPFETNGDPNPNENNTRTGSSQTNQVRNSHDPGANDRNIIIGKIELLTIEVNDRNSRKIGSLIGNVNVQIQ